MFKARRYNNSIDKLLKKEIRKYPYEIENKDISELNYETLKLNLYKRKLYQKLIILKKLITYLNPLMNLLLI